jgi:INO80 complex subunit C
MAPITTSSNEETHQALLDELDVFKVPKSFRNPYWKPPQRRNKNVKQIIADASRKEASMMTSQAGSGYATPLPPPSETTTGGALTPAVGNGSTGGERSNIAQAAQRLDRLVLEKNQQATLGVPDSRAVAGFVNSGMAVTYTNIETAPSLHPSGQKHYCDITGLTARYTDPKTRLRYHNVEVFQLVRTMPQGTTEAYLAARGAHTVLK